MKLFLAFAPLALLAACGGSAPPPAGEGGGGTAEAAKSARPAAGAEAAGAAEDGAASPEVSRSAPPAVDDTPEIAALRGRLAERLPELADAELRSTPMPGVYELSRGLAVGYVSEDGRYLLEGDLIDLATGRQMTEERRRSARVDMLDKGSEAAILFAPEQGARHTVTVFTDIDCGYCRKLHSEIDQYHARGIAIRYLLYPRAGSGSGSYVKAVSAWCSDDAQQALTRAKQGKDIPERDCANPVDEHLRLGQQLGLRGTPMMVLPDGEVVQGYVPAEALQARLDNRPASEPLASR